MWSSCQLKHHCKKASYRGRNNNQPWVFKDILQKVTLAISLRYLGVLEWECLGGPGPNNKNTSLYNAMQLNSNTN